MAQCRSYRDKKCDDDERRFRRVDLPAPAVGGRGIYFVRAVPRTACFAWRKTACGLGQVAREP